MNLLTPTRWLAGALLFLGACGDEQIGSRFIETSEVTEEQGGELSVSSDRSEMYAGIHLEIPVGAVDGPTTVTLAPTQPLDIPEGETANGPPVEFGPDGLTLSVPADITLPLDRGPNANEEIRLHILRSDGSASVLESNALTIGPEGESVSFSVEFLARYQPSIRLRTRCSASDECQRGQICIEGACAAPPQACETDMDCAPNEWCSEMGCQPHSLCSYVVEPGLVDFGSVALGTTRTASVGIVARETVTVLDVMTSTAGPFLAPISLPGVPAPTFPIEVVEGSSLMVLVDFSPTAAGVFSEALFVLAEEPRCSASDIRLVGTAEDP